MVYKKLLNIEYNNKKFTIFIDEHNRRTFLEINELGEYLYPTLEDFTYLNNIYNNHNPFVLNDNPLFTFKEKVRITSGLIALTIAFNGIMSLNKKYDVKVEGRNVTIVEYIDENSEKFIKINDIKELSEFGIENHSLEEIKIAIENNPNLPKIYQRIALDITNNIYENYPEFDFRIFYENIKTLRVEEMSYRELNELHAKNNQDKSYVSGFYDSTINTIFTTDDRAYEVIYHELMHSFNSLYRVIENKIIFVGNIKGYGLNEAMTNYLIEPMITTNTYKTEGQVLNYLLKTSNYSVLDYNRYGITGLIKALKEKYPNTDIDYIVSAIDTIKDTSIKAKVYSKVEDSPYLLEELFNICIENINLNSKDIYQPFLDFVKLINDNNKELLKDYLIRYNRILYDKGYTKVVGENIAQMNYIKCKDINALGCTNGEVVPLIAKEEIFEDMGYLITNYYKLTEGQEEKIYPYNYEIVENKDLDWKIYFECFKSADLVDTPEFWKVLCQDFDIISPHYYDKIELTYNNLNIKEKLSNIEIEVGITKNNEIGFNIYQRDNKIISTKDNFIRTTNKVNLMNYIYPPEWLEKLDLNEILNEDFLKNRSHIFNNLIVTENNEIIIEPDYMLTIYNNTEVRCPLKQCWLSNIHDNWAYINVSYQMIENEYFDNLNDILPEEITLREVLIYYNILNEDKLEYEFTADELTNLFKSYIEETIIISKTR